MHENDQNLRIAESISARFSWNGQEFHEGDYVALLDGQIIAVAKTPEAAISALRAHAPDPERGMVVEVARPAVDVVR